ncbi:glycoside hydrolase family 2 TIM barrel-domain containing protein [Pseudoxanthomonas sangjuensis]|uniref:beta-mannosidase n=1 Tax=Pseudoxanthomonas sangjuensis TaxID=1503750 RepID=UPI0013913757|nr:glycoside hydrolase family 2 protein [Pseudoxanthomonas sangjuensis]KAF1710262.1 beta-mannosidase [Pseudoxanthomonas sangjuensis]
MPARPAPPAHPRFALKLVLWLACAVASPGVLAQAFAETTLDGGWQFRLAPGSAQAAAHPEAVAWHAATVPGTVHTDLFANRLILDPYVGAPEAGLQWIGLADWEYRTTFDAPRDALDDARSDLVFEGLDTLAEVFLNGEKLLDADNFFRTWRAPVQGRLREGGNELRIVFHSPIATLLPKVQAMPTKIAGNYPSPYGDEPKDAMTANFVRKPGYHYGWDWGPRYVTAGVWKPVKLQRWDALRIDDVQLRQDKVDAERADVAVRVGVDAARAGKYELRLWRTAPDGKRTQAAKQDIDVAAGTSTIEVPVAIDKPQRWFPAGYGAQPLYRFDVEIRAGRKTVASASERTGLRSVALVRTPDARGRSFHFEINGIPVFAKGANSIPFDMFQPRVTKAQLRRVLESAVAANMNMIRSWGGGYYESDDFFDIADELGLLVWQDFMFGGGMQPAYEDAFRDNVIAEARDNVRRLRDHPSIVLWCGNNEEEIAWKYWGGGDYGQALKAKDPAFAEKVWNGYVQLFGTDLRKVVAEEAGGIAYWASSPSDDLAEVANTPASGDMHYWEVWGNPAHPPVKYLEITPRFMSEYGLQAWPVQRTIDAFARRDEQAIDSPVIEAHQKFLAGKGNERLMKYVDYEFGEPKDFADFVYLSQAAQAEGIELAALHHRASRPYTMGSLYWQLNDVWPGASWSGIDWFGRWKALQFHARRFFAPVAVAALRNAEGKTQVSLLNDRVDARRGELRLRVMSLDGKVLRDERKAVELAPLSSTRIADYADAELLAGADPATTVAVFELEVEGEPASRDVVYFRAAKDMAWADPGLHAELRRDGHHHYALDLHATKLARAVWIDFGDLDAEPSDNALTLLPGESATLRVDSAASLDDLRAALKVRTLADAL